MADDIVTQLEWLHSEFYDVDSVTSIVELAKAEIELLRTEFSAVLGDAIAKDAEIERLRAAVDAIDVLHQPDAKTGLCSECAQSDGFTTAGYTEGPCDTYLLLHPKEARRD